MHNYIAFVEFPVTDFERARKFYEAILQITIEEMEMPGARMGFFPNDGQNVSGAIVHGEEASPAEAGVLVYLNGGDDLNTILQRVQAAGGTVIMDKSQIGPEMGHYALFRDTEGNRVGLYSMG